MRTVTTRLWRKVLVLSAAAALGFLALATAIGLVIDAPHLLLLQHRHAETSGQLVRLYPNSHGLVEIGYSVGGTPYKRDVPVFGLDAPRVEGGPVRVYYDPNDPSIAFAAPPGEIIAGQIPFWVAGSLLGSVFAVAVVLRIIGYRERPT